MDFVEQCDGVTLSRGQDKKPSSRDGTSFRNFFNPASFFRGAKAKSQANLVTQRGGASSEVITVCERDGPALKKYTQKLSEQC